MHILLDASTNEFGIPEWLTYVTRLPDRKSSDWVSCTPISFNLNFPNVVWPDSQSTKILKQLYRWQDHTTTVKYVAQERED